MPTFKRADQEQLEKAKDLLESGVEHELGFAKSMFFGRLKLEHVFPYPKQDAEEKRCTDELIAKVDEFMGTSVDPDRIDAEERIPQSVIDGLGAVMNFLLANAQIAQIVGSGFAPREECSRSGDQKGP